MKIAMKRLVGDEKGAAMVLVLILLLVGGLIAAPLLAHMGTGLVAGEIYEKRTAELYAADAGVEDALWRIQNNVGQLPCNPSMTWSYNITDADGRVAEVNDKSVEVTITYVDSQTFRVLSTATGDETGTQIEAYVTAESADFSGFLDNAITSSGGVTIRGNKSNVSGNISLPPDGVLDPPDFDPENGQVNRETLDWPSGQEIADFYWPEVEHLTPVPDGYIINIPSGTTEDNPHVIESLSAAGDLTIEGKGWIRLTGTIYIKGDLNFKTNPTINIDLNHQTIFAEGKMWNKNADVNWSGSGCIIAVGDIYFHPNISSGPENFVLVMSVEGLIDFQPGGDFSGAIVGNADVNLQPGVTLSWVNPEGKGINFPGADPNDTSRWAWEIETWEVIRLSPEDLGG